jgi:hypothetical protein
MFGVAPVRGSSQNAKTKAAEFFCCSTAADAEEKMGAAPMALPRRAGGGGIMMGSPPPALPGWAHVWRPADSRNSRIPVFLVAKLRIPASQLGSAMRLKTDRSPRRPPLTAFCIFVDYKPLTL